MDSLANMNKNMYVNKFIRIILLDQSRFFLKKDGILKSLKGHKNHLLELRSS